MGHGEICTEQGLPQGTGCGEHGNCIIHKFSINLRSSLFLKDGSETNKLGGRRLMKFCTSLWGAFQKVKRGGWGEEDTYPEASSWATSPPWFRKLRKAFMGFNLGGVAWSESIREDPLAAPGRSGWWVWRFRGFWGGPPWLQPLSMAPQMALCPYLPPGPDHAGLWGRGDPSPSDPVLSGRETVPGPGPQFPQPQHGAGLQGLPGTPSPEL